LGDLRQTDGNALGARITTEKTEGNSTLSRIGGAIFTNWRLAGWLNTDEMQDANWIVRENPNVVVVSTMGKGQYSCNIDKKSVKVTPRINNGQLKFELNIKAVGKITEQQVSSLDLTEPQNLQKLEAYKSQKELGIDYLGFDRALIINEPALYKELDWPEVYPNIPVEIKLDFRINLVGLESR